MKPSRWITAIDLYNYTKCLHRVYLDANGDPGEKGEVSSFAKLLWELGLQTEREYLDQLGEMPVTDLSPLDPEAAFKETLSAMKLGKNIIYQGMLAYEHYRGRPDLLVKREDGASSWGDYYYEAIDIKAGRGWEGIDGKRVRFKKHYAYQMLFYRELLKVIQGYAPPMARIINVDGEFEEFDPEPFERDYRKARAEVERLVSGQETSEPVLGSHCLQCEWFKRCEKWVQKTSDPTGVFFIGSVKFALKQVGLNRVQDLAQMDVKKYLKPPLKIPRMGERALKRAKERAQVVLDGEPRIRSGYSFPSVGNEVYFDIEDDPTRGLTYLFGLLTLKPNKGPHFRYFMADHPEEEEETIRAFWDYLRTNDDAVYYVYSHKERSSLKHLMDRYQLDPEVFEKYVRSEFDLYQNLVVEYSDWPTFSYGIKFIAKQIGFTWRDKDPSGANSIVWYNDFLSMPFRGDIRDRILQYNEDDCRAMVALKQYFVDKMK
ncbi:MAG TPA: TM0106 family RecB-like putative nuclease [Nitrospiria bacterium]|jgi:uncharacterized protein